MKKIKAKISGVHGYVPDYVLTNAELETMVETSDEWITTRTGIKERRILKGERQGTSVIGIEAAKGLLEKTNTDPADIDLLICATCTPDMMFPSTANIIAEGIGAINSYGFDLQAACSGFLFALATGSQFIESGTHQKVLVVGADKMSSIVDYTDRTTCIIFGDGGGAADIFPLLFGVDQVNHRSTRIFIVFLRVPINQTVKPKCNGKKKKRRPTHSREKKEVLLKQQHCYSKLLRL